MREVEFKNKKAQHTLYIQGKRVTFENSKAMVTEEVAQMIEDLGDKDYTVIPEKKVEPVKMEQPKKQKSRSKKSRK